MALQKKTVTYIWLNIRKDIPCVVVFVTTNAAEVLVGVKHLHVEPNLQSAATLVDQSQYQMSQKCHRGPAMLHLSPNSMAGVSSIFPFTVWPRPYWCHHT